PGHFGRRSLDGRRTDGGSAPRRRGVVYAAPPAANAAQGRKAIAQGLGAGQAAPEAPAGSVKGAPFGHGAAEPAPRTGIWRQSRIIDFKILKSVIETSYMHLRLR